MFFFLACVFVVYRKEGGIDISSDTVLCTEMQHYNAKYYYNIFTCRQSHSDQILFHTKNKTRREYGQHKCSDTYTCLLAGCTLVEFT